MTGPLAPAGVAAIAVLSAFASVVAFAGEPIACTTVPTSEYASFLVNWDDQAAPVFLAAIRTPREYAAVFHPAPVMGNRRPFAPPADFYADSMLLVVARVIDAPAAADTTLAVESLVAEGEDLVLRYRFTPPTAPATHTVKEVLLVRLPKRVAGRVGFIENGERVGDLRLSAGEWAAPQPRAD